MSITLLLSSRSKLNLNETESSTITKQKINTAVDKTVESGSRAIRIVWRESRNHSALVCRYHNTRLTGRPAIANQNKFYRSPPLQKCQVIVSVRLGRRFTIDASLSAHDRRLTVHVRGSPLSLLPIDGFATGRRLFVSRSAHSLP